MEEDSPVSSTNVELGNTFIYSSLLPALKILGPSKLAFLAEVQLFTYVNRLLLVITT